MFYAEIITLLRGNTALAATVSTHNSNPAIFSNEAPEAAEMPYSIVRIESKKTEDSTVAYGDLYIDYYDYNKSRVTADTFGELLENLLDQVTLSSERLANIRIDLNSQGHVDDTDPRTIHYNSVFGFRGMRSKWMTETQ